MSDAPTQDQPPEQQPDPATHLVAAVASLTAAVRAMEAHFPNITPYVRNMVAAAEERLAVFERMVLPQPEPPHPPPLDPEPPTEGEVVSGGFSLPPEPPPAA